MSDSGHGVQGDGAGQGSEGEARVAERMLDGERRGLIHCAPPIHGNRRGSASRGGCTRPGCARRRHRWWITGARRAKALRHVRVIEGYAQAGEKKIFFD